MEHRTWEQLQYLPYESRKPDPRVEYRAIGRDSARVCPFACYKPSATSAPGRSVVEPSGTALVGPLSTVSEFGRLVCVLLQDPEVRNDFLVSTLRARRLTVARSVVTFGEIRWSDI
jgi:hypothetical protein